MNVSIRGYRVVSHPSRPDRLQNKKARSWRSFLLFVLPSLGLDGEQETGEIGQCCDVSRGGIPAVMAQSLK